IVSEKRAELAAGIRLSPEDMKLISEADTGKAEEQANENRLQWLSIMALVVCTVGILNAMLMSVTERFREIGTMKCLGALDSFIIKLFLLESLFQGVVGTLIGIIVGLAASVLSTWSTYGSYAWINMHWSRLAQNLGV